MQLQRTLRIQLIDSSISIQRTMRNVSIGIQCLSVSIIIQLSIDDFFSEGSVLMEDKNRIVSELLSKTGLD